MDEHSGDGRPATVSRFPNVDASSVDMAITMALAAGRRAHVPVTGYAVGAAIYGSGGLLYGGCKIETENGTAVLAECAALSTLRIGHGGHPLLIAVAGCSGEGQQDLLLPHPDCRDLLASFTAPERPLRIVVAVGVLAAHSPMMPWIAGALTDADTFCVGGTEYALIPLSTVMAAAHPAAANGRAAQVFRIADFRK